MLSSLQSVFKIQDLRNRILFTLGILIVYRIGSHITLPNVNPEALMSFFDQAGGGGLFGLYDMFVGGAFSRATIFSLGIMPYISASIIIQLLGAVMPYFQRLQKQGEEGRRKITQYSRYGTVLISLMQAYGVSVFIESITTNQGLPVVPSPGWGFRIMTMVILASGTVLIMWFGEQLTERGIGNGISLIIFVGIIALFPNSVLDEWQQLIGGNRELIVEVILLGIMVVCIGFVTMLTQGTRKIPVQYAKRVVGRKIYGGQSTHIPLRVNTAGVMPIIFAQSLMFVPQTVTSFWPDSEIMGLVNIYFNMNSAIYQVVYAILIIFFTYFYTAIAFNPVDVADNMKKHGGFIPGVRPGKKTAEYIDNILTRVTLPGSFFLAAVAVLPYFIIKFTNVSYSYASFFGGTSLLIIVGVALDTLQQMESHLLMRHYDGFMKGGKIKGRR
ncbi:MAG: preprotein translocase subunit SecY [Calditrichaeota bacterium]|nr:MAG: preprotein translocase subunit SecY [Calditrichota bacterium]